MSFWSGIRYKKNFNTRRQFSRYERQMKRSYIKYILGLLLFGSNGIVASFIVLSSYEIVLLRTMIGSLLLLAIFFGGKGKLTFYKYKAESICLLISGIAMGTSWIFLYEAYARIGVSIASLLYYCGPVIVMVLSPLLFREKLTSYKVIGFCQCSAAFSLSTAMRSEGAAMPLVSCADCFQPSCILSW